MKIILSTYNFYPVHKGGTEVYTRSLARYLQDKGHRILIIAAHDPVNEITGFLREDNAVLKAVSYTYENIEVLGISFRNQSAEDIYKGYNENWTDALSSLLDDLGWRDAEQIILNGLSTLSGVSLCEALLRLNPNLQASIIVHTPFLCPKANMIFSGNRKRCMQEISAKTCSACMVSEKTGLPFSISTLISGLTNNKPISLISNSVSGRLENLITEKFNGFQKLNGLVSSWIVLSHDMEKFLALQEFISNEKIFVLRHGIDSSLFHRKKNEFKSSPIRFLYAGRFEVVKGVKLLAQAWYKLPQKPELRQLQLAGDWKETKSGQYVFQLLGKRRDVQFIESLKQKELAELYQETHCVIVPSTWIETGPMVIHEAIACGCDIISSDIGGQGELADLYQKKSTKFKSGYSMSMKAAIEKYIPVPQDVSYMVQNEANHFEKLCKQLNIR